MDDSSRAGGVQPAIGRFTGRQIVIVVVAVAAAIIAFPIGVFAVGTGSLVSIVDPTHSTQKAKVNSDGHLLVSNGQVALTVDGATAPLPPTRSWSVAGVIFGGTRALLGPTPSAINVSSLTVYTEAANGSELALYATHVNSTATKCGGAGFLTLWYLQVLPEGEPFTVSFPAPLHVPTPPSGQKTCLYATSGTSAAWSVNGYLGS